MGVVIKIGARKAFLRDGEWRCAEPEIETSLNAHTRDWILATGGPPLESADPEADVAMEMSRRLGARVLLHSPARTKHSQRRYFALRQYSFDFLTE